MIKKSIFLIIATICFTQNVVAASCCPKNYSDSQCKEYCKTNPCIMESMSQLDDEEPKYMRCSDSSGGFDFDPDNPLKLGYTIYYECPLGGTPTPASTDTTGIKNTYTLRSAESVCKKTGYHGSDWACYKYGTNTSAPLSLSGTYPYTYDVTCKSTSWVANTYNLTYTCGDGTGSDISSSMTYGTTSYSLKTDSGNCSKAGSMFDGWSCKDSSDNDILLKITQTTWNIASNVTCTAKWKNATINIKFNDDGEYLPNDSMCTIGGTVGELPTPPRKPGYKFTGWKPMEKCGTDEIDKTINATGVTNGQCKSGCYSKGIDGTCWNGNSSNSVNNCNSLDDIGPYEWKTVFDYGTIYGEASCNNVPGTNKWSGGVYTYDKNNTYPMTDSRFTKSYTGPSCWCRITGYKPNDKDLCKINPSGWVYQYNDFGENTCNNGRCAMTCAAIFGEKAAFREGILDNIGNY